MPTTREILESNQKKLGELHEIITGNTDPEKGIVFRLLIVEKNQEEIKDKLDNHIKSVNGKPVLGIDPKIKDLLIRWALRIMIAGMFGKYVVFEGMKGLP